MTKGRALASAGAACSRNWPRRALVAVAALVGAWLLAAGALLLATPMLEILAWQPMHRGDYEGADPLLQAGAVLTRVGTWIRVPGQRLRLARYLGDLGEAREQRGSNAEAAELYLESIAILEAERPEDSEVHFARWRYERFLRSNRAVGAEPRP